MAQLQPELSEQPEPPELQQDDSAFEPEPPELQQDDSALEPEPPELQQEDWLAATGGVKGEQQPTAPSSFA